MNWKLTGLILGPLLFFVVLISPTPVGMGPEGKAVLASTLWIAVWWVSEAVPIPVTSLLPIILFPLTGALPIARTTASFAHPLVFLYIGGFIIAVSIEKWNLHKRIALGIIARIGARPDRLVLGFMLATALLSMWISNTATAVMMLPIAMALVGQFGSGHSKRDFGQSLMLGIAYSASIGGIATLIGTPTNLVLAGVVEELYGHQIAFSEWFIFGLPIAVILLAIAWFYLARVAYSLKTLELGAGAEEIRRQQSMLGPMSTAQKRVAVVFSLAAVCWITRSFLLEGLLPGINDTIIAIGAAILLFIIPAGESDEKLLDWKTAVQIPWGIALLFGGGLALAAGFQESGLAAWIGVQFNELQGVHLLVLLLFLVATVNFLTEITSNVATASMILPILASLAIAIGVHPYLLMVGATVAASCAFMLPVATPPNAIVFGSGYLRISDMVRKGFWMNVISILFLTLMVYYALPRIWDLS